MTYLDINQSKHQINNLFVFITFRFFSVPYINAYVAGSLEYPSHYKISNFLYVKYLYKELSLTMIHGSQGHTIGLEAKLEWKH